MVGATQTANKADKLRFDAFREIGCLPCHIQGIGFRLPTVHHVVEGRKRLVNGSGRQHQMTIPICEWHHLQALPDGFVGGERYAREYFGPSLESEKRRFVEQYGAERDLITVADAAVRMVLQARDKGESFSHDDMTEIVQALHREIVGGSPPSARW